MSDGLKASGSRKRSAMELSKALAVLGYGTWNNLEPECERNNEGYVRDALNKKLFQKIQDLELKRESELKEQLRLAKMPKNEKRKMQRQQKNEEIYNSPSQKFAKKSVEDEERAVHEAYQILLSEYHIRKTQRDRNIRMEEEQRVAEALRLAKAEESFGGDLAGGLDLMNIGPKTEGVVLSTKNHDVKDIFAAENDGPSSATPTRGLTPNGGHLHPGRKRSSRRKSGRRGKVKEGDQPDGAGAPK